ncbi:MAG: M6 family metalloprotease domain-containing protein [Bacteroidales bacterium]
MKSRILFFYCLFVLVASSLWAIPASNQIFTQRQSDGRSITFTLNGDEFIWWAKSVDNFTLIGNNGGELVYAIKDEKGDLIPSSVLASNPEERTIEEKLFLNQLGKGLFYSDNQLDKVRKKRNDRYKDNKKNSIQRIPTTGNPNFLVILVNFSDVSFDSYNISQINNQISQTNYTSNGATGSVKDYFFDNSMGLLNANFTVVGPFTLPHTRAYYGAQTSYDVDSLPNQMAYDAVSLANSNVNFASFDNDNDGFVDMVHIIYPGRGQHNGGGTDAIWAHSSNFPSGTSFDGVNFYKYSCSSELQYDQSCDGIGAICHEMSHVLGLPDFYDTDYAGSGGLSIHLGSWDLMASGGYNNNSFTPPFLSGVERKILGWVNPIVITDSLICSLPPLSDSNKVYRINLSSNEYLMLENRNQKRWDEYTEGKGILVFHCDNAKINNFYDINTIPTDRGCFIEPANGNYDSSFTSSTPFPGSNNVTYILNPTLKNGTVTDITINNITYNQDSIITFNYNNIVGVRADAHNITNTSALLMATYSPINIISKGFIYRIIISDTFSIKPLNTVRFEYRLYNLSPNTEYEYKAYIINSNSDTIYSPLQTFITPGNTSSLPDVSLLWDFNDSWNRGFYSYKTENNIPNSSVSSYFPNNAAWSKYYNLGDSCMVATSYFTTPATACRFLVLPLVNLQGGNYLQFDAMSLGNNKLEKLEIIIDGYMPWTILTIDSVPNGGYNTYTVDLTNYVNGIYPIAFRLTTTDGYMVAVDNIKILGPATLVEHTIPPQAELCPAFNITAHSAMLYANLYEGTDVMTNNGFKYKKATDTIWTKVSINVPGNNYMYYNLTNLAHSTVYDFYPYASTIDSDYAGMHFNFVTLSEGLPVSSILWDFNDCQIPSDFILYKGDTNSPSTDIAPYFPLNNAWEINHFNSGDCFMDACSKFYINYSGADRWAITPEIKLNGGNYLQFDAIALSGWNEDPEKLEVRISSNGDSSISSFANLLQKFDIYGSEDFRTFKTYTIKLDSSYENIRIAFRLTTNNYNYFGSLAVDNIKILGNAVFTSSLNSLNNNPISFLLYPNPAQKETKLIIKEVNEKTDISIYDIQGREVSNESIKPVNNWIEKVFDLSSIPSGTYFLRITNNKINKTQKLIVE